MSDEIWTPDGFQLLRRLLFHLIIAIDARMTGIIAVFIILLTAVTTIEAFYPSKFRSLFKISPRIEVQSIHPANKPIFQEQLIGGDALSTPTFLLSQILISCILPVSPAMSADLAVVSIAKPVIDTLVNVLSVLFLARTVLSWYPKTDLRKFPYNVIAWPTEALNQPVRDLIPPAFGVDISSLVWIMLLSFVREIMTGQQGILTLIEKSAI